MNKTSTLHVNLQIQTVTDLCPPSIHYLFTSSISIILQNFHLVTKWKMQRHTLIAARVDYRDMSVSASCLIQRKVKLSW